MRKTRETSEDQRTLGLSDEAHVKLTSLKDEGYFAEMRDAYRLAITMALAEGRIADRTKPRTHTYLNVGSLDPDGALRDAVAELYMDSEGPPYEVIERLGEEGVLSLWERLNRGSTLSELFLQPDADTGNLV